jgi:hypothetical protein
MSIFESGKKLDKDNRAKRSERTADVINAFYNAELWEEKRKILNQNQEIVLSNEADEYFSSIIEPLEDLNGLMYASLHIHLLEHLEENGMKGIDAIGFSDEQVIAVQNFYHAETWDRGKDFLEPHKEFLELDSPTIILEYLGTCWSNVNPKFEREAKTAQDVLARIKTEGFEAVFANTENLPDKKSATSFKEMFFRR